MKKIQDKPGGRPAKKRTEKQKNLALLTAKETAPVGRNF